jgi:hypothetical protein
MLAHLSNDLAQNRHLNIKFHLFTIPIRQSICPYTQRQKYKSKEARLSWLKIKKMKEEFRDTE